MAMTGALVDEGDRGNLVEFYDAFLGAGRPDTHDQVGLVQ